MKTFAVCALAGVLAFGTPGALAQQCDDKTPEEATPADTALAQRPDQILYKGLVGNLLEAVPMDAEKRVELQRGNAVVSAPLSARSVALLLGIASPIVLIGGLAWGIWAASRIEAPAAKAAEEPVPAQVQAVAEASSGE